MNRTATDIPENFSDFLYWVKEKTENFWSKDPNTSTDDFKCEEWMYGAKWIGLSDNEIDKIEEKYAIKFMPEHREFLRVLHAVDRKEILQHNYHDESWIEERPFFYNWLCDDKEIREYLDWPFRTVYDDVIGPNQFWLNAWGEKPGSEEETKEIVKKWYKKASPLLPLQAHRFLVSDEQIEQRPILSVWGSDIIIMGWSLKYFLISEFEEALGLLELKYNEEEKEWYTTSKKDLFRKEYRFDETRDIPGWKEVILYWSSGWAGFGLEYPGHENLTIVPIVKADPFAEGGSEQKLFTSK